MSGEQGPNNKDQRRQRLGQAPVAQAGYNPKYTKFIRWMRLILPMIAMIMVAVVFTWSNMRDDNIVPVQEETGAPKTIGKNELLNPRFESTDEKKQPYTITAQRAIQGKANEDLIILEQPLADMLLKNGNWVAIQADKGAFRQDNQRLFLNGTVRLFHDQGYQLETAQLYVDLEKNTAWSDVDVHGQGPAGTLDAKGLKADANSGHLVFEGPATLVLSQQATGKNIGTVFHE